MNFIVDFCYDGRHLRAYSTNYCVEKVGGIEGLKNLINNKDARDFFDCIAHTISSTVRPLYNIKKDTPINLAKLSDVMVMPYMDDLIVPLDAMELFHKNNFE